MSLWLMYKKNVLAKKIDYRITHLAKILFHID